MKAAAFVLSVLTLNVAGPRRVHQGWQTRRDALSLSLKAERPDVAAFQEAWRSEDVAALADAAGHTGRAHDPALGLAVTSLKQIVDQEAVNLGDGCGILRVGLDLGAATVDVYAARLTPGKGPAAARRLGQLLAAAEFIRTRSLPRPFVLLGDLAISSDEREADIFQDLLGTRDLCVSHGDEMCGRTFEDRRVDYILTPYSARPPRETARAAFTEPLNDNGETRPLSTHFGLAVRLDHAWLEHRLAFKPEGREEALITSIELLDAARVEAESRAKTAGWLPWHGAFLALRAREETAQFRADIENARTALARRTMAATEHSN